MDYVRKSFAEVKFSDLSGESDSGFFEGHASLFGVLDSGDDIVDKGAFSGDLPDFLHHGFIGFGHDWEGQAIGTVASAFEDERGLFLRGEYHSTPLAQQARQIAIERQQRGKSVGLSIGFKINGAEGKSMDDDGHRHLKSLKLYEVSQVNVPMLRPAGLTNVKGFGIPFEDHSEQVRVALAEWLERAMSGSDVRLKEGRALSTARMSSMEKMRDALHGHANEITAMLTECAPKPKAEDQPEDFSGLYAAWLLTEARLNGLPTLTT